MLLKPICLPDQKKNLRNYTKLHQHGPWAFICCTFFFQNRINYITTLD